MYDLICPRNPPSFKVEGLSKNKKSPQLIRVEAICFLVEGKGEP